MLIFGLTNDTYSAFSGHRHPASHRKTKNKIVLCSNTDICLKITVVNVYDACVFVCVCVVLTSPSVAM
jgi:hypothetical protein